MSKSFRSIRCLLLVCSSVSLIACGSSGDDRADELVEGGNDRPTIVSSDAATIRDLPDTESPALTDSAESVAIAEPTAQVPADDPAIGAETSAPVGEINTIEDLLAHLEAKRIEEDAAAAEGATDSSPGSAPGVTEGSDEGATAVDPVPDETTSPGAETVDQPIAGDSTVATTDTNVDTTPETAEQPPTTEQSSGENSEQSAEQVGGDQTVVTDPVSTPTDETSEEGVAEGLQQDDNPTPDAGIVEDNTVDGSFSSDRNDIVIDCNQKLPCAASNADGAVAVVVENVYRHPQTQRLAIALSVTGNRDTALRWDNDITSTDDVATTYNGTSREFSGFYQFDKDNDMVTLLAGTTLLVVQHFREMPSPTTVSMVRFDTGYIEAGVRTALTFTNMPLDPVLGDIVDCADQVPCSWVANDQSYSVNVLKTSGLWQTGRLRIDFEVRSTVGMGINLYSSGGVIGNDGSVFTPRTHSLGGTSDYQEFTVQLVPEGIQVGHQDFLKNANRLATSLVQVKLGMTRVDAPGAGSPVFRNLPLE